MTFTYEGADLSTTIKTFNCRGNNYHVTYLDDSESRYYCSNDSEEERLNDLLLEQVLERDANMQIKELELSKEVLKFTIFLSCYLFVLSSQEQEKLMTVLSLLAGIFSIKNLRERRKKIKELQKYRIFVEIMEDIKKVSIGELLKSVEFEPMYQKPLDLAHLDEYELWEIKTIRKELARLLQKNDGR